MIFPRQMKLLLIASLGKSLINFRGPLIAALQARGLQVHVAAPDLLPGDPIRRQLQARGVLVHNVALRRTGTNPVADAQTLWILWRLMRRVRPDFVLAYTVKPVIYGSLAAWLAGVPRRFALVTGLGYAFQQQGQGGALQALVHRLYSLALERVQCVFFQNPDDEALFRQRALVGPGACTCVVNGSGVDVAAFSVAPLPPGPPCFLLIARLLGDKGVREYAQAACRIRALHPGVRCQLVGWIDTNPDAIAQHELDTWVEEGTLEFLGRLSDVRPAIAACSVYVLPSYREGTPRTVLEAMAMGRAVITTDAPGCRETVVEGNNGFMVPVQSTEAMEQAMLKFVHDPNLAARMGQRARQMVEDKYDVHKVNVVMLREMGWREMLFSSLERAPYPRFPKWACGSRLLCREVFLIGRVQTLRCEGSCQFFRKYGTTTISSSLKGLFDLFASVLGLLILILPFVLLTWLVHRMLALPVFFCQVRPGPHGRPLELVKFRLMTGAHEPEGVLLPGADQLTHVSQFLWTRGLVESRLKREEYVKHGSSCQEWTENTSGKCSWQHQLGCALMSQPWLEESSA